MIDVRERVGFEIDVYDTGTAGATRNLERLAKGADSVEASTKKMGSASKSAGGDLEQLSKRALELEKSMTGVKRAFLGFISIAFGKKLLDISEGYRNMSDQVRLATTSLEEFQYVQSRLLESSNATQRRLSETQQLFIDTSGNLRDMGFSLDSAITITDSFSYALVRNATNAERAMNAISAYDYALNKRTVDVNTWKSISSALPTLEVSMAQLFQVPLEQIQKLGFEGKLTVDQLNDAFLASYAENKMYADSMTVLVSDAITVFMNKTSTMLGGINETLHVTELLSSGIVLLADNLALFLAPAVGLAIPLLVKGLVSARVALASLLALIGANPMTALISGVAFGVTAIYQLVSATEDAHESFVKLGEPVDELVSKFTRMNAIQRDASILEYQKNLISANNVAKKSIDELAQKMTNLAKIKFDEDEGFWGENAGGGWYKQKEFLKQFQEELEDIKLSSGDLAKFIKDKAKEYGVDDSTLESWLDYAVNINNSAIEVEKINKLLKETTGLNKSLTETEEFQKNWHGANRALANPMQESEEFIKMLDGIINKRGEILATTEEEALTYRYLSGQLGKITEGQYQRLLYEQRINSEMAKQKALADDLETSMSGLRNRAKHAGLSERASFIMTIEEQGGGEDEIKEANALFDVIDSKSKEATKSLDVFTDKLVALGDEISRISASNASLELYGYESQYNAVSAITLELESQGSALSKLSAKQQEILLARAQELDAVTQLNSILEFSANQSRKLEDLEFELSLYGKSKDEIEQLRYEYELFNEAKAISIGMTEENIQKLNEEIRKILEVKEAIRQAKEEADNDPWGGVSDGFRNYSEKMGSLRDQFATATESVMGNLEKSLLDFAETGKFSFRDMTASILRDLSKILIQMALVNAVKMAMGGGYANGGIVGGVSAPQIGEWSDGGYTGMGGKYEPAGIVHKGEVVWSQADIAKHGGLHRVENMRLRGFANGGAAQATPLNSAPTAQKPSTINLEVIVHQDGAVEITGDQLEGILLEVDSRVVDQLSEQQRQGGNLR